MKLTNVLLVIVILMGLVGCKSAPSTGPVVPIPATSAETKQVVVLAQSTPTPTPTPTGYELAKTWTPFQADLKTRDPDLTVTFEVINNGKRESQVRLDVLEYQACVISAQNSVNPNPKINALEMGPKTRSADHCDELINKVEALNAKMEKENKQ